MPCQISKTIADRKQYFKWTRDYASIVPKILGGDIILKHTVGIGKYSQKT
jgi:hypothetical protein